MDLFDNRMQEEISKHAPLADRMRPRDFSEFAGQGDLVSEGSPLRRLLDEDRVPSMIFWGPPGTGKTTLAKIIAKLTNKHFITLSAVASGVKDVRRIVGAAGERRKFENRGTILFIDEIHRFNKAQQDAFLPHVESGTITLIGATTENPSFEVISALLSRCQVYVLNPLSEKDLEKIVTQTLEDSERGLGELGVKIEDDARVALLQMAGGDARYVLNLLEIASNLLENKPEEERVITTEVIEQSTRSRMLRYDKGGEEHYNIISALHKSMRGSDVQASIYWLGRMLEAGEDPMYVVRRVIRFASEDVGNADPEGLKIAVAAQQALHFLGMPEGALALAQAVIYLAAAPKSNSAYTGYGKVQKEIKQSGALDVPLHVRNAPTSLMKDLGYGKGYKYAHNYEEGYAAQEYLPDELAGTEFYKPGKFGFEKEIKKRMDYWEKLKKQGKSKGQL